MAFDFISFLMGVIVGVALAAFVFARREAVRRIWLSLLDQLRRLRDRLTANMESRYQAALRARLDQLDLMRDQADFNALYVEQRFDPPPARPTLAPIEHDPSTISVSAALRSASRLVVLGDSGSGRTTLLIHLARTFLARQAQSEFGVERERLPVFLHLAEIDWSDASDDDPLSTLLFAATAHAPRLVATNIGSMLRNRIRSNNVWLLFDGFDELPASLRMRCVQWLAALLEKHPDNPIVITAGLPGYGTLQNLGFAPLQLADWTTREIDQYAERWIKVVSGGKQDLQVLSSGLRQLASITPRPIDLALAAGEWRVRTALPAHFIAAYEQWLDRAAHSDQSKAPPAPDKLKAALAHVAWTLLQANRPEATFEEIEQAIGRVMSPAPDDQSKRTEDVTEIARDLVDHARVLVPFGLDGWAFAHRSIATYLVAWQVTQNNAALEAYEDRPEWAEVFEFHSTMVDPVDQVQRVLSAPDDLGRSRLWAAARWMSQANPDAPWRSKVMGELARALIQPQQYRHLRDQALNSLLITRDKGLTYLLKHGLAHSDPIVRYLSLQGLGKLNREIDLPAFVAVINDSSPDVRMEAIRSIGVLARNGSNAAVEQLIKLLLEQDEDGRRLVAEMLAHCGEEGYQILREGVNEEDIKVRRAAAYGLAETGQDWARDLVRKLERDDKQWFVRSAATDALGRMQIRSRKPIDDPAIDLSPIVIDQQGWLVEWAAQHGVGIGVGRQATTALMRALDEGDQPVRLAAIQTLRHIGDLAYHDKLRTLLYDPDRAVRDAAFEALEAIGQRTGQLIPR